MKKPDGCSPLLLGWLSLVGDHDVSLELFLEFHVLLVVEDFAAGRSVHLHGRRLVLEPAERALLLGAVFFDDETGNWYNSDDYSL